MSKRQKKNSFKPSQVSRVHPDDLPTKHHHHHTREQTMAEPPRMQAGNAADEYELETIARMDDDLSLSSALSMRAESPPIEVIQVSPPVKKVSQLTLYRPDVSKALVPFQSPSMIQPSIRSFVVSPTSHLLREVSRIPPTITIEPLEEDEILPEPVAPPENPPFLIKIQPKTVFIVIAVLLLAVSIGVVVVLSILLAKIDREPTFSSNSFMSSICASNCLMSITPFLAPTIAFWKFEGVLTDKNNIYTAAASDLSTSIYVSGHIGQAVSLTGRYLSANTRFMNLSYQSWTIEAWIWLTVSGNNWGIFGQCESSTTSKCLSLTITNKRLRISFYNNDLSGTTIINGPSDTWRHVAFVYDYSTRQQLIYLDGALEASTGISSTGVGPYEGSSGEVTIGRTASVTSFTGYIDEVKVSSGAKTACEIYNDASLTVYYPFDTATTYLDMSNNAIHGSAQSLITLPGRVDEAYSFQYSYSYFQSLPFTAYSFKESFSISLWVKPYFVNGGTLLHLSENIDGSTDCFDLLGFSSSGQLIAQLIQSSTTNNLVGPTMSLNVWTHIAVTYSPSNGMALYTNGVLRDFTGQFDSFPSVLYTTTPYMTVGNPGTSNSIPACTTNTPALSPAAYRGSIDELRIYSRELTDDDICSLYNP